MIGWLLLGTALAADPVIEKVESGTIDWTSMVLQVTVRGDRTVGAWQGREIQEADALSRLQPTLMEAARMIRVQPNVRAESLMIAGPGVNPVLVRSLDDGLEKIWRVRETRYLSGGGVEMDGVVDLHAWLRPALQAKAQGVPQSPTPDGQTGLLIDARHLAFRPCLAPEIRTVDTTLLFGIASVATQTVTEQSPVVYVTDPADPRASERAGSQPEFVTAASSTGKCTLILSEQDSSILPAREGLAGWLATARVVIVVDMHR